MAPLHGSQIGNNFISLVNAIVRQSEVIDSISPAWVPAYLA